jgi:nitrogen-specific signal transduction histidine kinase
MKIIQRFIISTILVFIIGLAVHLAMYLVVPGLLYTGFRNLILIVPLAAYVALLLIWIILPLTRSIALLNGNVSEFVDSNFDSVLYTPVEQKKLIPDIDEIAKYTTSLIQQMSFRELVYRSKEDDIKHLRMMLDHVIIEFDREGRIILTNTVYRERFTNQEDVFDLFTKNEFEGILHGKIRQFNTSHGEQNAKFFIHWKIAIEKDPQGNPVKVIALGIDITEKKEIELRMVDMQKLESLGRLAGGMAHDFKNYITCIYGYLELLTMKNLDEKSTDLVDASIKTLQNAYGLVEQILIFCRRSHMEFSSIKLEDLYEAVDHLIKPFRNKQIIFTFEKEASTEAVIIGDKTKLTQIVLNLVINAIDAVEANTASSYKGAINLLFKEIEQDEIDAAIIKEFQLTDQRHLQITVNDNGPGITEETLAHLFEPFYTTKEKGTGLGLSIIFGIVKEHAGGISLRTEVGSGTEFIVYIPLESKESD